MNSFYQISTPKIPRAINTKTYELSFVDLERRTIEMKVRANPRLIYYIP